MKRPAPALARPRAILFDWDNTLIDSWTSIHAALDATFRAMGREPWGLAETRVRVRASLRDSFPGLFGERWHEAEAVFYRRYTELHLVELREMPGAGEMLRALSGSGIPLGVVSNKRGGFLRAEAAHLGWQPLFSRLVGAGDAARDKPAADPVALALGDCGIAPGPDVWLVGDADIDLACAVNAGCVPVLLRAQPPSPSEFGRHAPAWHAADCATFARAFA